MKILLLSDNALPTGGAAILVGMMRDELRRRGHDARVFAGSLEVPLISETEDWRPVGTTIIRLQLVIGGGCTLLLFLLAPSIAVVLHEPDLVFCLQLFAIDIVISIFSGSCKLILLGINLYHIQARVRTAYWLTRMFLIVILVEMGYGVVGAILGSVGASAIELILCCIYLRPPLFVHTDVSMRGLLRYSVPLLLFSLSQRTYHQLALFMLKLLGGTTIQAGYFSGAQNITRIVSLLLSSFSYPLLSTLKQLDNKADQKEKIKILAGMRFAWSSSCFR